MSSTASSLGGGQSCSSQMLPGSGAACSCCLSGSATLLLLLLQVGGQALIITLMDFAEGDARHYVPRCIAATGGKDDLDAINSKVLIIPCMNRVMQGPGHAVASAVCLQHSLVVPGTAAQWHNVHHCSTRTHFGAAWAARGEPC